MYDNSRRTALKTLAAAAGVCAARKIPAAPAPPAAAPATAVAPAGRLKQSACRWPYARAPLAEMCSRVKQMGLAGIDRARTWRASNRREAPIMERTNGNSICASKVPNRLARPIEEWTELE